MKVLVVAHSAGLSGANKSLISILNNLASLIEFTVLINGSPELFKSELKDKNIKIIPYKYEWWYSTPRKNFLKHMVRYVIDITKYYSYRTISKELQTLLFNENFDLVYTNTSTVDIGVRISNILNIPHVWHIREFGKEDFGFKSLVSQRYRRKCIENSDAIITISKALQKKYSMYTEVTKLHLVYNGFDVEELSSSPTGKNLSKEINILISGQVCEPKGQEQAVDAVAILNDMGYNVNLYVAGDIDHSYFDKVLIKYNNPDWLRVLGRVQDMYGLRNKIDIELVCSKNEAFGRVTLEAMLHNIPVIASNGGANPELIQEGITGLLYESQNISQLVEKICILIDNPSIYEKIRTSAFVYAQTFTIYKTANEVHKIFLNVLEK